MSAANTMLYSDPPGEDNSGIWKLLGDALGATAVRVNDEMPTARTASKAATAASDMCPRCHRDNDAPWSLCTACAQSQPGGRDGSPATVLDGPDAAAFGQRLLDECTDQDPQSDDISHAAPRRADEL